MFIDTLENSRQYEALHKHFKTVFDFIKTVDLSKTECGRYELEGKELYVNIQEYETKPVQKLEAHKKYIDIQYVIEGEEMTGYCNIENTSVVEEYNPVTDVTFLKGDIYKFKMKNNAFLIFYPQDAHMPALSTGFSARVKKAIFKIAVE